jgi:succinate dehydrogenase / fumarate reductase iron-sulfur subunit
MVLDALIHIKNTIDPTLTFRRSCREGVCGSCAMNIDGTQHAGLHPAARRGEGRRQIYPLPHMPVVKDLVPDLTLFYAQYASIEPWLQTDTPEPQRERRLQSPGRPRQAGRPLRVHPVRLLLDLLPQLLVERRALSGPGHLLQAYRWLADSRDEATGERLDALEDPFKLYRCHTIMNCAQVCPKGLNPAKAIAEIKKMMVERVV